MSDNSQETSALADILSANRPPLPPQAHEAANSTEAEVTAADFGCYGWLTNPRDRADMLELRRKSGHVGALPYAWIDFVEFEPSEGITLHARGSKFVIKGRNLNAETRPTVRLFQAMIQRRVPWIREAERAEQIEAPETAPVIESIEW